MKKWIVVIAPFVLLLLILLIAHMIHQMWVDDHCTTVLATQVCG